MCSENLGNALSFAILSGLALFFLVGYVRDATFYARRRWDFNQNSGARLFSGMLMGGKSLPPKLRIFFAYPAAILIPGLVAYQNLNEVLHCIKG